MAVFQLCVRDFSFLMVSEKVTNYKAATTTTATTTTNATITSHAWFGLIYHDQVPMHDLLKPCSVFIWSVSSNTRVPKHLMSMNMNISPIV